jgi:hypothetical protein
VSGRGSGLEGSLSGDREGERVMSSTSDGVLVNDGTDDGEDDKREGSGSKFRNSVQSASKVESAGCNRSSSGISNKAEKSSPGIAMSTEDALAFYVHQQIWEEISRDRGSHNPSPQFWDHRARFSVIARFGRDY